MPSVEQATAGAATDDDATNSFRLTGAARRMQVLLETNALLERIGFGSRSFEDYDDLVTSVSSMAVALYEKLFQFHLDEIVRVPKTANDYEHNAQRVVDALSGALLDESFDTANLTGASLCEGDAASIQRLVRMFAHIHEILYGDEKVEDDGEAVEMDERERGELEREYPREKARNSAQTPTNRAHTQHTEVRSSQRPATTKQRTLNRTTRTTNANSTSAMKKRTRRPPPTNARANTKGTRQERVSERALDEQLLTTQRYGRYVPVPRQRQPHSRENEEDDDAAALELAAGETYFGGMSSVSGASGSAASIHFMEEEGDFARNFSAIQSHSSPGTDSKDSPPELDSTPDRSRVEAVPPRSKNQQDAAEDEDTTSPVKKKLAMQRVISPSSKRNAQPAVSKPATKPAQASLYPLLPETTRHDRTSKAHSQHLRYKLQLKDHLQELRHREFCQRQHLERAYKLGEHAANVERIRTHRFEQELRLHRLAIGLEAKTQEEKQLRVAMQHLLHLEKEKLRDEHKTTKQMLRTIQSEHAEREQALENFYATQIQLVKEQTRRELVERDTVEKAHRLASEQMIREMRRERERELSALLKEKQHLAEVRRFKHETLLSQAVERGAELSTRQGDAFYTAAMKARQLRAAGGAKPLKTTRKTVVRV